MGIVVCSVCCTVCGKKAAAHPWLSFHGCRTSDGTVGIWRLIKPVVGSRSYNLSRPTVWFNKWFDNHLIHKEEK
jgi:hypothetical protein